MSEEKKIRETRKFLIGFVIFTGLVAALLITFGALRIIDLTATIVCTCSAVAFCVFCSFGVRELNRDLAEIELEKADDLEELDNSEDEE